MIDRSLDSFSVSSRKVVESPTLRLDATAYNRGVAQALAALEGSGMALRPLGEVTERVFMPTRFKRTYVKPEHGVPFLQGSHIVQFQPADLKYLSLAAHKDLDPLLIRPGWVLVTRSGTTGRVAIVPPEWDGWAASEHVFRVVPKADGPCPVGWLATFLASPLGQAQLSAHVYGAVVDELTEAQLRSILVPVPRTSAQRRKVDAVHQQTVDSVRLRAEAVAQAKASAEALVALLPAVESVEVEEPPTQQTAVK